MKLYIDIDGVLLKLRDPHPADYAEEFISYIVEHFDCYWLTTHCKGDTTPTIEYLSEYFTDIVIEKLKFIKPTMWCALKTDAIDFSSEFIWLDDYIMNAELSVLKENDCADSVYKVDLERENLLDVLETINQDNINQTTIVGCPDFLSRTTDFPFMLSVPASLSTPDEQR